MRKVIVTLRGGATASIEVPGNFPRKRGEKGETKAISRSIFGAIRLFPGIPKAITGDELAYVEGWRRDVFARLEVRPYVESKRVDYRGIGEEALEALAESEGVGHLPTSRKVEVLAERGKLKIPDRVKSTETRLGPKAKDGAPAPTPAPDGGGTAKRKPK